MAARAWCGRGAGRRWWGSGDAKGVCFPSLTLLRRSDILAVFQVHRRTLVRVLGLAFIERRDRGPLPTNKGDATDQGCSGSVEGDPESIWPVQVEIYPTGCNYKFMNCPREVEIHLLESLADRRDPCWSWIVVSNTFSSTANCINNHEMQGMHFA
jgi:hypothetical protein